MVKPAGPAGVLPEPRDAAVGFASARLPRIDENGEVRCPTAARSTGSKAARGRRAALTRNGAAARASAIVHANASSSSRRPGSGDAILSEPLIALMREPYEEPVVDVLAPPWCAPVYARMRGIRRVIESPLAHGKLDLPARRALAERLKDRATRARSCCRTRGSPRWYRGLRAFRAAPATSASSATGC